MKAARRSEPGWRGNRRAGGLSAAPPRAFGPPYAGTWGIACEKEGEAIEFRIVIGKSTFSCLKLYPQAGLDGVALSNTGEGRRGRLAWRRKSKASNTNGWESAVKKRAATGSSRGRRRSRPAMKPAKGSAPI
jgi:hypothetical protein